MSKPDDRKVALVTGASRGIGHAIVERLVQDGFHVVGTATGTSGCERIRALFASIGVEGATLIMNVENDDSVSAGLKSLEAGPGLPLVLVNNAGVTRDNLLMRMKVDEWNDVVNTNLGALYRLCRPVLRIMTKARWGRIVNLSSVVGRIGNPGQSNYAASKAGIEGFTRALAQEVGSRNVTVNAVAPGFIDTDMTQSLTAEQRDAMLARVPLARLGRPEDVAAAVAFLISDAAGYITGETLHVNGGLYMS